MISSISPTTTKKTPTQEHLWILSKVAGCFNPCILLYKFYYNFYNYQHHWFWFLVKCAIIIVLVFQGSMQKWLLFTFDKVAIFSSFSSSSSFLFHIFTYYFFTFLNKKKSFFSSSSSFWLSWGFFLRTIFLKQNLTFQLLSNFEEIQTYQNFQVCNLKFQRKKSRISTKHYWLIQLLLHFF